MSDGSPTLPRVLEQFEEAFSEQLHTSMPGRVVTYDPMTRSATVIPTLSDPDGNAYPPIFKVPVANPGGFGYSLTIPLGPDDHVLLVFSERALEDWIEQGASGDPHDVRRHSITDAIAIPILWPFNKTPNPASSTDLLLGKNDGTIVLRLTQLGKVKLGNEVSGVELLDLLDQLITELIAAFAAIPFSTATLLTIQGLLQTIKG